MANLKTYFSNYQKPEYTKEEHPLSALYRLVGFKNGFSNQFYVYEKGKQFKKTIESQERITKNGPLFQKEEFFVTLLNKLELPKKKTGGSALLNYYPYIPELTLIGNLPSERHNKDGTSGCWNLGNFIKEALVHGSKDENEAKSIFNELFNALGVSDEENVEDIFCLIISKEIKDWIDSKDEQNKWNEQDINFTFVDWNTLHVKSPSIMLVNDIKRVLKLKKSLTRFQWINLLSGLLRLGLPMHLIWIYRNYILVYKNIIRAFNGLAIEDKIHERMDLLYMNDDISEMRDILLNYKKADIFIEFFISYLNEKSIKDPSFFVFKNLDDQKKFYYEIEKIDLKNVLWKNEFFKAFQLELEKESKELNITKSALKNRDWFIKHIMEQGSAEGLKHKKELDQYFWFKSYGRTTKLCPGSGQSILFAFLASKNNSYCSLKELLNHLKEYGIGVHNDSNNQLITNLNLMGLITDNPDSDSGLTITNPLIQL